MDSYEVIEKTLAAITTMPEITAAAICSADGLQLYSSLSEETDGERIGALSAALLSVGSRIAEEILSGDPEYFVIQSANDCMVSFCSPDVSLIVIIRHHADLIATISGIKPAFRTILTCLYD